MSGASLPANPTLADFQKYVAAVVAERGFDTEDIAKRFMLLMEETGEFARAARTHAGIKTAADTSQADLEHEAADVFILLVCLCNMLGVDLERAVRSKEELNKTRTWK